MASEYGRTVWEARQKDPQNGHEELLVFGYSCKLFRDNEKAQYVERGEHLIPWMGDQSLMVDRYDVRGALYDLREAESGGGGDRWAGLTEEERAEEERCDHERYLALYHDEYQYQEYQDEESKRLVSELGSDVYTYSQVGFSYDQPADGPPLTEEQLKQQQEQYQQQQEQYQQEQEQYQQEQEKYQKQEEEQGESGYFPNTDEDTFMPPPELNVPSGMTVPDTIKQNKIIVKTSKFIVGQGGQMEIVIKTKQAGNPMFGFLSFDSPLNAYYKHMVTMIKNGRYRPSEEADPDKGKGDGSEGQYLHPSLSAGIKPDLAPGTPTPVHKPSADCAYSKLINKIKEKQKVTALVEGVDGSASPLRTAAPAAAPATPATPAPVASTPEVSNSIKKKKLSLDVTPVGSPKITSLVDYPSFNQTAERTSGESDSDMTGDENDSMKVKQGSSSEYSNIKWPPPDLQMVIDKMASYIIKNGADFESMVRSRNDPRFEFLKKDHEYNPYYRCKIRLYTEVYGDIFKEGEDKGGDGKGKRGASKGPSTISFSIKSREQEVNLDRHSTFPVESSSTEDEDMDDDERERRRAEREERRRKRKLKEKEERERREREERERKEREEREREKGEESSELSGDNEDMYDIFKYAQEMDNGEHYEEERREEGSECVRPCEPGTPQPDQLRQERRKKAAMFLSRLKKTGEEEPPGQPLYGPIMPPEIAAQLMNSASQSPRSSLASVSRHSRSRSRSASSSPGPAIPMPPREAPAPPPPPPPAPPPSLSPAHPSSDTMDSVAHREDRASHLDMKLPDDRARVGQDASVVPGASEEGRRSQSVELRRSKSRPMESTHREKTRSRKKQRRGRSDSRSPSSRRERKKRKRSRSRTRRHKKRRSRSRSRSKTHSRSSRKKKRSKHSTHHERADKRAKKSRRRSLSSSSSSSSSERSYSSSRSSDTEDEVQVLDSPVQTKRWSRASSEVSVGASDMSLASSLPKIPEEIPSVPSTPPLPPLPLPSVPLPPPALPPSVPLPPPIEEKAEEDVESGGEETKDSKEEKKLAFNPQTSAAMARIAMGLRAKVHALLEKDTKL